MAPLVWKKGRGKLGPMAPLLGGWKAKADTPMGPVSCVRGYAKFGDGYVRLEAAWTFQSASAKAGATSEPRIYREFCIFGADPADGVLGFWSYTSDGKRSHGKLADGSDVHPQAVCFEARMDAGLARQVFWPDPVSGMRWAVEARNKKGWNRFSEHHYRPA